MHPAAGLASCSNSFDYTLQGRVAPLLQIHMSCVNADTPAMQVPGVSNVRDAHIVRYFAGQTVARAQCLEQRTPETLKHMTRIKL